MNLTPREKDKLLVSLAAMVARGRLARGVKLNHPEAIALITDYVVEGARDGRSVADLMSAGAHPRPTRVTLQIREAGSNGALLRLEHRALQTLVANAEKHRRALGHREHQVKPGHLRACSGTRELRARPRILLRQHRPQRALTHPTMQRQQLSGRAGPAARGLRAR